MSSGRPTAHPSASAPAPASTSRSSSPSTPPSQAKRPLPPEAAGMQADSNAQQQQQPQPQQRTDGPERLQDAVDSDTIASEHHWTTERSAPAHETHASATASSGAFVDSSATLPSPTRSADGPTPDSSLSSVLVSDADESLKSFSGSAVPRAASEKEKEWAALELPKAPPVMHRQSSVKPAGPRGRSIPSRDFIHSMGATAESSEENESAVLDDRAAPTPTKSKFSQSPGSPAPAPDNDEQLLLGATGAEGKDRVPPPRQLTLRGSVCVMPALRLDGVKLRSAARPATPSSASADGVSHMQPSEPVRLRGGAMLSKKASRSRSPVAPKEVAGASPLPPEPVAEVPQKPKPPPDCVRVAGVSKTTPTPSPPPLSLHEMAGASPSLSPIAKAVAEVLKPSPAPSKPQGVLTTATTFFRSQDVSSPKASGSPSGKGSPQPKRKSDEKKSFEQKRPEWPPKVLVASKPALSPTGSPTNVKTVVAIYEKVSTVNPNAAGRESAAGSSAGASGSKAQGNWAAVRSNLKEKERAKETERDASSSKLTRKKK